MHIRAALSTLILVLFGHIAVIAQGSPPLFPKSIHTSKVATLRWDIEDAYGHELLRSYPVLQSDAEESIVISFDLLDAVPQRIYYTLSLRNVDWSLNPQIPLYEYLQGAIGDQIQIDESSPSEATRQPYRHYECRLGHNEALVPLLASNYLLTAWSSSDDSTPLFEIGFALTESLVSIQQTLRRSTRDREHLQSVEPQLTFPASLAPSPLQELTVIVGQNGSSTRWTTLDHPSALAPGRVEYQGLSAGTFAAGYEFRAFDLISSQMSNMGVESLQLEGDLMHARLYTDHASPTYYTLERDVNGRQVIQSVDIPEGDPHTTTDYYLVTWTLEGDELDPRSAVYLEGAAVDALPPEARRLTYDSDLSAYSLTLLIKGGYVSYRYSPSPSPSALEYNPIEGDYYQTDNEYTTLVYLTPPSARYHRLVGMQETRDSL